MQYVFLSSVVKLREQEKDFARHILKTRFQHSCEKCCGNGSNITRQSRCNMSRHVNYSCTQVVVLPGFVVFWEKLDVLK